ncbi:hypothetical protein SAMN04488034_101800 [Salinimicrobium catena]|uniref:Uncharacterized protein n=1 Tax=Salinimicrobium catena TaxID=390640 RepID=A0A1H5JNP9_9FLAO|nr:hypothetical protein [Salinimicrobium catena]SDL83611.1 hypothetical protein SAMN04488140_1168 [Salinimicrobium catena]SEE54112.1 hypothetical protein SAMN04488034_101800 [Salinimicrobium catena]
MVTIVGFKSFENEEGKTFHSLVVQGDLEAVKSKETNNVYFTAKTALVSCTFNETTCKELIGTKMPGLVKRVEVEPYEYTDPSTGEISTLTFRNRYFTDEQDAEENEREEIISRNIEEMESVI